LKTCGAALKAHLAGATTTLAYLWKIKRVDGGILGFTTHDQDITYDAGDGDGALTYAAATGFTATATAAKSDLSPDNSEALGFLESSSILEADIRAGRYDACAIWIRLVNWSDLTMGDVLLRRGTVGQVKMKNGQFTAEVRGLASKLVARIGATYGPICRATFGSGTNNIDMSSHYLCRFDVSTVRQTGSVASAADVRTLTPAAGLTGGAGWFDDGFLTFTSGALSGDSFEIKTWDGTTLELFLDLPLLPHAGDTFTIEPGCNRTTADCQGKYNNIANFRGEPMIPGMDQLLDYPSGK
jgi:uncharacterized phage protein (TIGR02218 family)